MFNNANDGDANDDDTYDDDDDVVSSGTIIWYSIYLKLKFDLNSLRLPIYLSIYLYYLILLITQKGKTNSSKKSH